jgi:hypothetical protein
MASPGISTAGSASEASITWARVSQPGGGAQPSGASPASTTTFSSLSRETASMASRWSGWQTSTLESEWSITWRRPSPTSAVFTGTT